MSHNKGKKFAVARDAAELQRLEDRIDGVLQRIKQIRKGLQDGPLNQVVLKLGTFEHYLDLMEPLSLEYKSTFDNEIAMEAARKLRAQIDGRKTS